MVDVIGAISIRQEEHFEKLDLLSQRFKLTPAGVAVVD